MLKAILSIAWKPFQAEITILTKNHEAQKYFFVWQSLLFSFDILLNGIVQMNCERLFLISRYYFIISFSVNLFNIMHRRSY